MLYKHADESLDRAEDRAMDHYRALFGAGAVGVGQVEALGRIVIELYRRDLPFTLERVGHVDLYFGAVKRAFLRIYLELDLVAAHRVAELRLGHPPLLLGAEMLIGHGRELETEVLESELSIHVAHHLEVERDFVFDLVLAAEDVRVVLRHRTHPHQAVQRARALRAMQPAELRDAHRQVA